MAEPEKVSAFVALQLLDDDQAIISMACDINEGGHGDLSTRGAMSSGGALAHSWCVAAHTNILGL